MIRVKNPNYTARLPNEYQEVEYLESTGLQYIDTGVGITTALSFECEWAKTMTGAGLNGSYYFVSSTTKAFCFGLYADNKLYVGVGSTTNTATAGSLNTKYKTVGNSTSMTTYENDVSKVSITGTLAANNLNFYLFAAHRNQGTVETGYYGQYKIYTCKLYENNILVRNFVPCYRKIDNVPGLYDIINNTFYENQGTGTFLIGSEVNKKDINIKPKITKKELVKDVLILPEEYQRVKYIESSGTQYIDTGVIPTGTTSFKLGVEFTSATQTEYAGYFGVQVDGSNTYGFTLSNIPGNMIRFKGSSNYMGGPTYVANTLYEMEGSLNSFVINGVSYTNTDTWSQTMDETIYLFARNSAGAVLDSTLTIARSYYTQIYENNILIRDLVPCYRKSDNVAGLYDIVNNIFYTNIGTGTFTTGEEISNFETIILEHSLPEQYQELDYIESSGIQYIDTEVTGEAIGTYEIKFNMLGEGYQNYEMYFAGPLSAQVPKLYLNGDTTIVADIGTAAYNLFTKDNNPHIIKVTDTEILCDDIVKATYKAKSWGEQSFWLFNAAEQPSLYSTMQLYYLKMYSNGILVRDYIPCYKKEDNIVGLYDLVNNHFYPNANSENFIKGTESIYSKLFSYSLNKKYVGNKVIYNRENDEDQEINYTYLYDYGNECADITGGWSGTTYSTGAAWAKNTNHLYMKSYRASVYTLKAIDLTDYTYMIAVTETRGRTTTAYSSQIFYSNTTISASSGTISAGSWPNATSFNVNINGGAPYNFFIPIKESLRNSRYLAVSSDDSASLGYINLYNMTIFKEDDCSKLAELIGLANDSIENIINHSKYLLNNEEAVRYMVKHYTGDFMARALGSEKFLLALESSPYKTIVHANKHWNQFLTMLI